MTWIVFHLPDCCVDVYVSFVKKYLLFFTLSNISVGAFSVGTDLDDDALLSTSEVNETTEVIGVQQQRHSITETEIERYSGFSKVIARDEIDGRFVSVAELLNKQAGVQVHETGGVGSYHTVSIRGSSGRQVNAYLDGMLLNSPSSGVADLTTIPSLLVESIQIYPSSTPVQLGHANLSGAINITSREIINEQGGQFSLTAGSFATYAAELSYWQSFNDTEYVLSLGHQQSDNDYAVSSDTFANSSTKRVNAGVDQNTLFFKMRKQWGDVSGQWLLQYADAEHELPTSKNAPYDDTLRLDESLRNQFVVDYNVGNFSVAHRVYWMTENKTLDNRSGLLGLSTPQHLESDLDAFGLINALERQWDNHQFALSLEVRKDAYQKENLLLGTEVLSNNRNAMTVGISDDWQIFPALNANAVLRYFYVEDTVDQIVREDKENKVDILEPAIQLGLKFSVVDGVLLKSNMGQLIRTPTLDEKYGLDGDYQGDPNLKHETMTFMDVGFELDYSGMIWQASVFYQRLTDGIYVVYDGRGIGHPVNYSGSIVSGVESDIRYDIWGNIQLQLRNTLLDSENHMADRALYGKKLPGIYHLSHYFAIHWRDDWFASSISYGLDDDLFYTASNQVDPSGINQLKADTKKNITTTIDFYMADVTVNVTARNLLNKNFMDFNRMPSPGRSLMTTLSINF